MRIDHVIYATSDLAAATGALSERIGAGPSGGGRHDGIGTENRILPLRPGYLEVLAIADPEEAAASGLGGALAQRLADHGDGLWAWAAAVDDVEAVAERLDLDLSRIGRSGFSAALAGVARALADPALPFFISRDHGVPDPGDAGTAGGLTWLEVSGDEAALRRWLGDADLPVRCVSGPPGVVAMGIGDTELRR